MYLTFQLLGLDYHIDVGFGIAYPRMLGCAKALAGGIGKGSDSRVFFLCVFQTTITFFTAIGSRAIKL